MTLDDINNQLAALANCGDQTFANAAQYEIGRAHV